MPLTVAEAMALPVLAGARTVAGAEGLHRPIRWAHASDLYDVAAVLLGGELLLTTGTQLGPDEARQRVYVRTLADRGVAGVVVECVRRFQDGLPAAVIEEAEARRLPLAEVRRTVRFVEVTQAIHSRILGEQLGRIRRADDAGQALTRVVLEERGVHGVLRVLGQTLGRNPVAWLPSAGAALVHPADADWSAALALGPRGAASGRRSPSAGSVDEVAHRGAIVRVLRQPVWVGGRPAGTLVCVEQRARLDPADLPILDRAAAAIATQLLLERGAADALAEAQREVVARILAGGAEITPAVRARAVALADLHDRAALTVVVGPAPASALRQRLEAVGLPRIAVADGDRPRAIVGDATPAGLVHRLERALGPGAPDGPVGAGGVTDRLEGLREAWRQAEFVALLRSRDPGLAACFDRLGGHGLLYGLRHSAQLERFVAASLGGLDRPGETRGGPSGAASLLQSLQVLLECNGNKLEAARRLGLRRQSLYLRLQRIERALGRALDDPGVLADLRLALVGRAVRLAAADEAGA